MSFIKLSPNTSGTGALTLSAPNTDTDRTLTLPDSDGTMSLLTVSGRLAKSDPYSALLSKTGTFSVVAAQDFYVDNRLITSGTSVTMPGTPVVGTDYALWVHPDGTLEATSNHVTPPVTDAVRVGGFHYAPGGCATGTSGGDSTPQTNEYSFWDLKFRVDAPDPRGMALVAGGFWCAIYMLNADHIVNGVSAYGVAIADGSTPPKIPTQFGGTGSNSFSSLTWYEAALCVSAHGLRMPTYQEHLAYAYGVTEATSRGSDPGSTGLDAPRTSKWGIMQATGNLYTWAQEFGGPYVAAGWVANTGGRGSTYYQPNAALLGGAWNEASNSGSGCATWNDAPSNSYYGVSVRGVGGHLIIT